LEGSWRGGEKRGKKGWEEVPRDAPLAAANMAAELLVGVADTLRVKVFIRDEIAIKIERFWRRDEED